MDFSYRSFLERELEGRRQKNPAYSLRAFARSLAMPASKLSQVMRGICGLSRNSALRLSEKLGLDTQDQEYFVALVESEHSRSEIDRNLAQMRVRTLRATGYDQISLEKFRIIAEWHFFALLEITEVCDFQSHPEWIASRLGITPERAREAVALLLKHGLLTHAADGQALRQTHAYLATPTDTPSQSIRKHHAQILAKAAHALEEVDITERDFSALTMAVDVTRLAEAKDALLKFRREFCEGQDKASKKNRVYCLAMQFFPLDQKTAEEIANVIP